MTLALAFAASDGFVLAADTLRVEISCTEFSDSKSKIFVSSRHPIMVAVAENDVASEAARILIENIDQTERPSENLHEEIDKAAREACKNRIIAPLGRQWLGTILAVDGRAKWAPILRYLFVQDIDGRFQQPHRDFTNDKMMAGRDTSPALFFAERYFRTIRGNRSVQELAMLAGHVITVATQLSHDRIDGLEIAVLRTGMPNPEFVTESTLRRIRQRAQQLVDDIEGALFKEIDDFQMSTERACLPAMYVPPKPDVTI